MEYLTVSLGAVNFILGQIFNNPLTTVGAPGFDVTTVTAIVFATLVPQPFVQETLIFPFCPTAPVVTVIAFVPAPEVITQPVGNVQLYVVISA